MRNILVIDTTDRSKVVIGLNANGKKIEKVSESNKDKSQMTLILIQEILRENGLETNDITAVEVNTGPGSFTGIRVGISIANALSYLLKIPVNNKRIGEYESAVYN